MGPPFDGTGSPGQVPRAGGGGCGSSDPPGSNLGLAPGRSECDRSGGSRGAGFPIARTMTGNAASDTQEGMNWRLGVGVFLAWIVGMSVVSGGGQMMAVAESLKTFGGGEYGGIVVALSALRQRGAGIATTATCLGLVASLHRGKGPSWLSWLLFALVPATPVAAAIMIATALAAGSGMYAIPFDRLQQHIVSMANASDVLAGMVLAVVYAVVLRIVAPVLLGWVGRHEWTFWPRLGGAWLVANLVRAPMLLGIAWFFPGENSEPQIPSQPDPVALADLAAPLSSNDRDLSCGCFDPDVASRHPSEPYTLARCRDEEGFTIQVVTCSVAQRRELTRLDLGGAKLQSSASIRWVPESTHVIAVWGAGSGVGLAKLHDVDGKELLDVYAAGVDLSLDNRFLASIARYEAEHRGQPGARPDAPPHLAIYDLRDASTVHERNDCEALRLEWKAKVVAVRCEGRSQPLMLALPE